MKLKEFTVVFEHEGKTRDIVIWTATKAAARESAECYFREEGMTTAKISYIR